MTDNASFFAGQAAGPTPALPLPGDDLTDADRGIEPEVTDEDAVTDEDVVGSPDQPEDPQHDADDDREERHA